MKSITIELDQFRDHLDRALAEAEQGELILTRQGKPWIVMRPAPDTRADEIPSEAGSCDKPASDPRNDDETAVSLVGRTVAWARSHFEKIYKTTLEGMAFVDGNRVPEDHVLEEGEVLEFAEEEEDEEWVVQMYRSPEFRELLRRRPSEEAIPLEEAKRRLGID